MTYAATSGNGDYAGAVGANSADWGTVLASVNLIDSVLGSKTKSSYVFQGGRTAASATEPAQFYFSALPTSTGGLTQTGTRRFGIATPGVIMADTNLSAHFADQDAVGLGTPLAN